MRKIVFILAIFLLGGALARSASAEVAVIVHKDNPVKSIARLDLELIYLGKKKMFENGDVIIPADLANESAARTEFFADVIHKDEDSYRLYWVRMIFSGKGQPPVAFRSEEEAVRFVATHKGAIAFVDADKLNGEVKAIKVVEDE
ncbi:MAG: phosphate ABC transporter substrate-binding protein [Nitrospinae bacterium]|nr:phosphate ABC transporter substrate-binding protein [Nitrospinota bacterium]